MKIFGTMALLAAIMIVGYSATNLFMAAYTASAEPYQQMLAGIGTAAVVAWEAGAVMLIFRAWDIGYRPLAVGSVFLLIVAMAVSMVWEARIVIGGRSDKFATREVSAAKLKGIEDDLAWLRERRKTATKKQDLEWITERITIREKDRDSAVAVKDVMPEASAAVELFGGSEARWRAILSALPLLFWMLARVLAVPLAMMAFAVRRTEARTAAKSFPPVIVAPQPVPAVIAFARPAESDPEPVTPPEPPKGPKKEQEAAPVTVEAPRPQATFVPRIVESAPTPKPKSKAERLEAVDAITRRWIAACGVVATTVGDGMSAKQVYADYAAFAGRSAVGDSHFGRSIKRCGFQTRKTATGAVYKLAIRGKQEAVA